MMNTKKGYNSLNIIQLKIFIIQKFNVFCKPSLNHYHTQMQLLFSVLGLKSILEIIHSQKLNFTNPIKPY